MPRQPNELANSFINFLAGRPTAGVNFGNAEGWARGAEKTILGAGNPPGSRIALTTLARSEMIDVVKGLVRALKTEDVSGQSTFDHLFFAAVAQIEQVANIERDTTLFTFGRAQKLISILLKYCYAWRVAGRGPSPLFGELEWVDRWALYLHVPVDRQTILHLNEPENEQFNHLVVSGEMVISWKWHLGRPRYCRIQDAVRSLALHEHQNALHYEMDKIWTQPNIHDNADE